MTRIDSAAAQFKDRGYASLSGFFDAQKCRALLAAAEATRDFEKLFLSETEFDTNPQYRATNPRPGRNLAEKLDTDFIFGDPEFAELFRTILGPRFRILDYKFVMGVPSRLLPDWLKPRIKDQLVNNLGPYIRPEYRDITYFHGIDYHQDIIDFPDRNCDIITAYLYLDRVRKTSAPLYLIPDTHILGCTTFPHKLTRDGDGYVYMDDAGNSMACNEMILEGEAGDLSFWHSTTLHGTQPQSDDNPRISVRILIEKNQAADVGCALDELNKTITGNLTLTQTRRDLAESGQGVVTGNTINAQAD